MCQITSQYLVFHTGPQLTPDTFPLTLKCVWTTETVFLVLMSSHKLSTYCIFFSQLFDVLEGASSLSKKPQCQMCLKQKPRNIWSSIQNSQAETWQEVLPLKKKNLQSCSIRYILPNGKQTSGPKICWSTIIPCFFSTGHRFSKSFVLPFNPFSTQYSFLPFYSTNSIMLLYVCIYSLWLCWGRRLVLAHPLCLEQCWYVENALWKFSYSGWSYKPSYPLPSPSPAYHVSSKPCWLLFVQNND